MKCEQLTPFLVFLIGMVLVGRTQAQTTGAGEALSFNAPNQSYVAVQHDPELDPYPMTITAWVKTQSNGGAGLVTKYISGALNGWQIYLLNGEVRAWYFADSANYVWDGGDGLNGGSIADGLWHQVAFTVDASGGKLYVDGILKASLGWTGKAGACTTRRPLLLGYYPGVGPSFLTGTLDEIALWSTNLSAGQIQAGVYVSGLYDTNAGLVLHLHLDDAPGDIAYDGTGHGHDGILVNSPSWIDSTAPISRPVATLTLEPLSRFAESGTPASFSVATSVLPASYQWRLDGQNIPGATNSTYLLPRVSPPDAGVYDVLVSNSVASVASSPAVLKVVAVPEILRQPV
ncbi:MAG: LamG-like jellyroll fold domain-containing protein, partial [Limisphaerales bacterium]